MKVTYQWLKDFVEIKISAQALADKLTMAGLEVTSLEEKAGDFIFEIEVTANRADCLSVIGIAREVAAITNKKLKRLQATGYRLQAKSLRRVACGMQPISINIENMKDCPLYTAKIIKDVKVGPSPDWLKKRLELIGCRSVNNVVDITNYVLFTWGEPLHAFDLDKMVNQLAAEPVSRFINIIIRRASEKEEIVTIDGIKRLLDNNVLVIACDKDNKTGKPANGSTISPSLEPSRAKSRGRQTGKPIAIAGIMGGQNTEVTTRTKNILLEAAIFNPLIVRRGRQKLGLQSESSYRFERGIDAETAQRAAWQAVELIQELCCGNCVLLKAGGLTKGKSRKIVLSAVNVQKILGAEISPAKIKNILQNLEFKIRPQAKSNFLVEVPPRRQDISLEIDLIEEIARIYGYAQIAKTLPRVSPSTRFACSGRMVSLSNQSPSLTIDDARGLVSQIKNILAGLGSNEVITYSLAEKEEAAAAIEILNPLSKEQEALRTTLIPGLIRCVALNLNQKQSYVNIFEIAKVFSGAPSQPQEELALGIAFCGTKSRFLGDQGLAKEEMGLLHLKGIVENLFLRLGIEDGHFSAADHPGEFSVYIGKEKIGKIIRLSPQFLGRFGIKNKDLLAGEILLSQVLAEARLEKRFIPLPKYPAISRDISFVLPEKIMAEEILKAVKKTGALLLQEVKIIDYYQGKQIPAGFKGLTVSCVYRSNERTLTEAEINPLHAQICALLTGQFGAVLRSGSRD